MCAGEVWIVALYLALFYRYDQVFAVTRVVLRYKGQLLLVVSYRPRPIC